MSTRLPAHLEVASLIRLVQNEGGIATVLAKGERDAGTILIVAMHRGGEARLLERMPQLDGSRAFVVTRTQDIEKPKEFDEYLDRRRRQDTDTWIIEADIDRVERFVAMLPQ
ncbi:MAG: DUF1491 family protein [Erythrobacter sp.]|uniref:DUF1491 family protein n=1 Tax=Erythrobacter sp. TaxID=1042 RepID=UPI003C72101F